MGPLAAGIHLGGFHGELLLSVDPIEGPYFRPPTAVSARGRHENRSVDAGFGSSSGQLRAPPRASAGTQTSSSTSKASLMWPSKWAAIVETINNQASCHCLMRCSFVLRTPSAREDDARGGALRIAHLVSVRRWRVLRRLPLSFVGVLVQDESCRGWAERRGAARARSMREVSPHRCPR